MRVTKLLIKFFLSSILVLSACLSRAETASYDDALKVAKTFMKRSFFRVDDVSEVIKFDTLGVTTAYAFNFDNGGFVLVSGSYKADPVLAYSSTGSFLPKDSIENVGLLKFLSDCNAEIIGRESQGVRSNDIGLSEEKWGCWLTENFYPVVFEPEDNVTEVPNLLCDPQTAEYIEWNQSGCDYRCSKSDFSSPLDISYNIMMPAGDGCAHTLAGCVPVALAQVMRKWRWPENVEYVYENENYYSSYNWDSMPPRLCASSSVRNMFEISTLLRDCGYMLGAKYNCGGTGTSSEYIYDKLIKGDLIGYNAFGNIFTDEYSNRYVRENSATYSLSDWLKLIMMELIAERPVVVGSIGDKYGHCIVISGFQRQDDGFYFYVNYGWGGSSDGYYNIDFTSGGYVNYKKQTALIGFSPMRGNENHEHDIVATCTRASIGNKGQLTFSVENANSYILKVKYQKKRAIGYSVSARGIYSDCQYSKDPQEIIIERKFGNVFSNGLIDVWDGDGISLEYEYETQCDVFTAPAMYEITFMNNYGQIKTYEGVFTADEQTHNESFGENVCVSVLPNPTSGSVSIVSSKEKIVKVSVADVMGDNVKIIAPDNFVCALDLSSNPKGCYFVSVETENSIVVKKIIKY